MTYTTHCLCSWLDFLTHWLCLQLLRAHALTRTNLCTPSIPFQSAMVDSVVVLSCALRRLLRDRSVLAPCAQLSAPFSAFPAPSLQLCAYASPRCERLRLQPPPPREGSCRLATSAAPVTSRAVHQSRCPETAPASTAPLLSARVDVVTDLDGDTASTVSHESLTIVFADDVLEVKAGDCRGAYETRSAFASARPPLHHRWRLPPSSAQPIFVTSASSIIQPRYCLPGSLYVCVRERDFPHTDLVHWV